MILFICYPATGHYTAMLPLARRYRMQGHKVAFTGIASTKQWIEVNDIGFVEFEYLQTYFISGWKEFLYMMLQHRKPGFAARRYRHFLRFGRALRALATAQEVDMICLDISLSAYYIFLPRGKTVRIVNTSLSTTKSAGVPPLSCGTVMGQGMLWRIFSEGVWTRQYVMNIVRIWISCIATWGRDERHFMLRWMRQEGLRERDFFLPLYKGCFHYELDLDKVDINVWLLGGVVEYPWKRLHAKEENVFCEMLVPARGGQGWSALYGFMRSVVEAPEKERPLLIYCALGSMTGRHRDEAIRFIHKVLACVRNAGEFRLILSTGGLELSLFEAGERVHMERYLPQHVVLPYCAAAIIHGGMNTVKECVYHRVPMLVYPFGFDQYGNAARVVYSGLGLKGSRERDSMVTMLRKLRTVCKIEKERFYVKYIHERAIATGGAG